MTVIIISFLACMVKFAETCQEFKIVKEVPEFHTVVEQDGTINATFPIDTKLYCKNSIVTKLAIIQWTSAHPNWVIVKGQLTCAEGKEA